MSDDLLQRLKLHGSVPAHIAIIMDGNGRWAKGRALPRPLGHHAGMSAVREVIQGCLDADVGVLSLFAFSQENWQRPAVEILEHQIRPALIQPADVEDGDDRRVLQLGENPPLVDQDRAQLLAVNRPAELDRNVAIELQIAREIHGREAAVRDQPLNHIPAKATALLEIHPPRDYAQPCVAGMRIKE